MATKTGRNPPSSGLSRAALCVQCLAWITCQHPKVADTSVAFEAEAYWLCGPESSHWLRVEAGSPRVWLPCPSHSTGPRGVRWSNPARLSLP